MALLEILTICSLITVSPYYDCSEKWEIRLYDSPPEIQCNGNYDDYRQLGCAHHGREQIHLFNNPDYKDNFGQSILEHELQHLKCNCNYHPVI